MVAVTKTIGPLHLEDLEPHRFEDLIRQLLYDFRQWQDLEATGRTGSDDGFDARATEMVRPAEDAGGDEEPLPAETRLWLIQCKREKAIGPTKIKAYLEGLPRALEQNIYGLIFVAACDFSIASRDAFRERARELGFQEAKIWGKAEVEDLLFQPKNDHLLFAYFGVSLQVRKRSLQAAVRGMMTIKRKARAGLHSDGTVVVVDASDDRYPYLDEDENASRQSRGRWRTYDVDKVSATGVLLRTRRHFAYIDPDSDDWDFAERMNDATPRDDPWILDQKNDGDWLKRSEEMDIFDALEEKNKGWFEVSVVLPWSSILDIDKDGDDEPFFGPVIYTSPWLEEGQPPLASYAFVNLEQLLGDQKYDANPNKRIKIFGRLDTVD